MRRNNAADKDDAGHRKKLPDPFKNFFLATYCFKFVFYIRK